MKSVFVVHHVHELPGGVEDVKLIGVYRTLSAARAAVDRLATQPGFSKYPNTVERGETGESQGFYIDEYGLDKDHWTEGFVTMVGDDEYKE